MCPAGRPHLIGVDDGPFAKGHDATTPVVAVFMEGADLVEGVAVSSFPVDGDGVTAFLADWLGALRFHPAAQGIVLGGITLAGLGVVDAPALAGALGLPVLVVNRRRPVDDEVAAALDAAGLGARRALLARAPRAFAVDDGLWASAAGTDSDTARALLRASIRKGSLPEPLRLAHLIAGAVARGSSRGRA